jgi:hypothetical protein
VDKDDRGYKSEPEGHDDEYVTDDGGEEVTRQASVEYSSNEGNRDSWEENLLKTERGVRGSWCFLSAQCSFQNRGW